MAWVHGAGTPVGIVAEMLAAGLNANLGGRNHAPIEIERNAGIVLPAPFASSYGRIQVESPHLGVAI